VLAALGIWRTHFRRARPLTAKEGYHKAVDEFDKGLHSIGFVQKDTQTWEFDANAITNQYGSNVNETSTNISVNGPRRSNRASGEK